MRELLFLFFSLVLSIVASGQVAGRFFYDRYWRLTSKDSAVFFRVCVFDTTNQVFAGMVRDYTKEGKLVMTGMYQGGRKNGAFVNFYANSHKESEGVFMENNRVGLWRYFYSNEAPKQDVFFDEREVRILNFFDSTGQALMQDGNGAWKEEYEEGPYSETTIINKGNFKNYQKDGTWTSALADENSLVIPDGNPGCSISKSTGPGAIFLVVLEITFIYDGSF